MAERRKKYNAGDFLGPSNILLKERTRRAGSSYYGNFICPNCGQEFECNIASIVKGHTRSCGCSTYKNRKGQGQKYFPGDILGPYNTLLLERIESTKGRFKCSFCNKEFITEISCVVRGDTKSCGCQRYIRSVKNGRAKVIDLSEQKFNNLTVIKESKHRNGGNHILWECIYDCGKTTFVRTNDLLENKVLSCGCVKTSKGESKIKNILEQLNIVFSQEIKFINCINPQTGKQLRFDFYLPGYNCCIEYDGEQHFEESTMCSDTLEERQERDKVKNQYCKDNNIKLIRIPYWDYNKLNENYLMELINSEK